MLFLSLISATESDLEAEEAEGEVISHNEEDSDDDDDKEQATDHRH